MFCNDFEFKSICFYDPRRLIHVLYVTGQNRSLFLLLALSSILHLAVVLHPTLSGTPSDTPSCTKMMGDLAVMVLAASDGQIREMGFSHAHALQLLNS
jgi:hypothetical protein